METGDYIRTENGKIDKVINNNYYIPLYVECEKGLIDRNLIIKHSKNIIDLIEEGDYVNGMEIDEFDDEEGNSFLGIPIYDDSLMDCIEEVRPLITIDIKTILTHEQYEQNCYKVKE